MDTAKCLYLGGLKIHANDERLIYSYNELGLRCCYCGEKVLYRNGDVNRPHFAHHPDIHEDKMAECLLRQRNEGYTISWSEISLTGKNQRFKIFQESFLELITFAIVDFKEGYEFIENKSFKNKLDTLVENCITQLKKKKHYITNFYKLSQYRSTIINPLHSEISAEALDYLCVKSSISIITKLIYYTVYIIWKQKLNEEKKPLFKDIECQSICEKIAELIFNVDWINTICHLRKYNFDIQFNNKELYRILKGGCLYIKDKNLFYFKEISKYEAESDILGSFLNEINTRYRNEYPIDIKLHIFNKQVYEIHKEKVDLFKVEIMKSMQKSQWKHPLSISVSNNKKISLSNNRKDIMFGKNRLASIKAQYEWHQRDKLQLNHFFRPTNQYNDFLNTTEKKKALIDIFREWLEVNNVKIPLDLGK
ncbi:hypothetical protein H6G64_32445 [Calothrix sp. FACHB-156]|nr:hypothetical protein [Calothrix sp. FACHB-156]